MTRLRILIVACLLTLAGTAAAQPARPAPRGRLDAVARDYVALVLELGERDEGYVDAYYGPAEWRAAARANPRTLPSSPPPPPRSRRGPRRSGRARRIRNIAAAPSCSPSCGRCAPGCACSGASG